MTRLTHNSRRQRRRDRRHMIHRGFLSLDLTPEEILAELEPNWFQGEKAGERDRAAQVPTDEAAA
jgi:hypothetical protein